MHLTKVTTDRNIRLGGAQCAAILGENTRMKLRDGGATILVVIAVIYFVDWLATPTPEPQCMYQRVKDNGETVSRWVDCKQEDLELGE